MPRPRSLCFKNEHGHESRPRGGEAAAATVMAEWKRFKGPSFSNRTLPTGVNGNINRVKGLARIFNFRANY